MNADAAAQARRKEAHRLSMIWTGAMIALSALAAAWIGFAPERLLPSKRLWGMKPMPSAPQAFTPTGPMLLHWREFAPKTLLEASKRDRLILLSIWASWSEPCRLMDGQAYADARVARMAEREVQAVRIDADARPDLALRYLGAGWPTTALLLPTGEVLDAGTFMSADVLLRWVATIADQFRKRREDAMEAALQAAAARRARRGTSAGEPRQALARARKALERTWDGPHGALFARFDRLAALASLGPDQSGWAPPLARRGLRASRALRDPRDGGYFRALDRAGRPEPGKRLVDQAEALAFLATADPARAARLRAFVDRTLAGPASGGYAASPRDRRLFCDDNNGMAAAILRDPAATPAQRTHALRTVELWWTRGRRESLARRRFSEGPVGLLGDQLGLLEALLAARLATGQAAHLARALELSQAMERALLDEKGEAFYDRPPMRELPQGLDRIRFAGLNARARRDYLALSRAAGSRTSTGRRLAARAATLGDWLWSHADGLDAGDLAELAEGRLAGN